MKGYTKMLADSRLQAVERLLEAAREAGANAVIAMRFDCNELGSNMTEVAAYGTGGHRAARVALSVTGARAERPCHSLRRRSTS